MVRLVVVGGRRVVVRGGGGLTVVVGATVVVVGVTVGTSGASPGRLDGTGNGSRVVSVDGGLPLGGGSLSVQPSKPSASATAPTASTPVRGKRPGKERHPFDERCSTLCDRANASRTHADE